MKNYCFVALLLIAFLSCSKDKEIKGVPARIQASIDGASCDCTTHIDKYTWRSQTVYVIRLKGFCCGIDGPYYDARGKNIKMPYEFTWQQFEEEATHITNYFTCTDSTGL